MKRLHIAASSLLVAAALFTASRVRADVDIHIGVPAPPTIVFRAEPQVVLVPETRVYYVPEVVQYDMYRYGSYWYVNQGGYWYRSTTYGGPFAVVEYSHVPRQIVTVPVNYRHHPAKPKHQKNKKSKH